MRTTCGLNFGPIGQLFLELLLQTLQNWAQLGHEAKRIRGIGPRGQFVPILGQKNGFFFINYTRIVRSVWDLELALFDSPKDAVSGKMFVFGIVLNFPRLNWAQNWTKTVNFGYAPFPLKDIILQDCSYTVVFL